MCCLLATLMPSLFKWKFVLSHLLLYWFCCLFLCLFNTFIFRRVYFAVQFEILNWIEPNQTPQSYCRFFTWQKYIQQFSTMKMLLKVCVDS